MFDNSEFRENDEINDPVERIVNSNKSPLRVLAGPGTGKTNAFMKRIARLLRDGSIPNRMMVSTFTRTAAKDLESEILKLGVNGVENICSGTLHSFCFRILYSMDVLTFTGRVPRPLLEFEKRFILEDLKHYGIAGINVLKDLLKALSTAWARLQHEELGSPRTDIDRVFQSSIISWLRFHKSMLLEEIVPEAYRYLKENPTSPYYYAFDHVMVDEYQDLNKAEQELIDLLSKNCKFMIIGDQDQSIYSFKHAHPEGIANFDQTHPGTHDGRLEICHRCPSQVVRMAKTLIDNNQTKSSQEIYPKDNNPIGEIHIVQWNSLEHETRGIARFIKNRITAGEVKPGRILVLSPRRYFGYEIRNALKESNVHAKSFFHEEILEGNPKKLDECIEQRAFTLLTMLANPDDRVSFRCWCGFGSYNLQAPAWSKLRSFCEETGDSPKTLLQRLIKGEINIPNISRIVSKYNEKQQHIDKLSGLCGNELVDALFPSDKSWTEPFRTLYSEIDEENINAQQLYEVLRTNIIQPELPIDVDYVRVMSLHRSKGLTADLVIVVGCIEGLIPSLKYDVSNLDYQRTLEEQRRLFYVAITRTTRILVLSSVSRLPRYLAHKTRARIDRGGRTIASQFLSELGLTRPTTVLGQSIL